MKKNVLLSLIIMSSANLVQASDSLDSYAVVQMFKHERMPDSYWAGKSRGFKTLQDAFDLAKINALFSALEQPEDTNGIRSLCSGFIHATTVLSLSLEGRATGTCASEKEALQTFIESCSGEKNDEGCAIQIIAAQLSSFIDSSSIKDFRLYNKWLQHNKNPETVKKVVSYVDAYYQTKRESHIRDFFLYLQENVKKDFEKLTLLP